MRRLIFFTVICLGVIFLSSCTVFPPLKMMPTSNYTITTWPKNSNSVAGKSVSSKVMLVMMPVASPGYTSLNMIYVTVPYKLNAFVDHFWVAPPAELLLPLIANRLRAKHYFKAVVASPFSGNVNLELTTRLLTLQQEFLQPVSQVRLVMEATLLNTATQQVIASRVFCAVVPAPGNNPYSGVLATNAAVHQVVDKIATFAVLKAKG